MTTKARAAHLRMMSHLPVRTHSWQPLMRGWGCKRSEEEEQILKDALLAMQKRGATRREMRERTGCTNSTILKLIGPSR